MSRAEGEERGGGGGALPVDHPLLAVVAPHRVGRFCAAVGIAEPREVHANFTGWSKLVLLTDDLAVLVPRDHTQVAPLRREVAALEVLTHLGVTGIPRLRAVLEGDDVGPHPIVVCDRLPGVPLADVIETMTEDDLAALFRRLGAEVAQWHVPPPAGVELRRRDCLEPVRRVIDELALDPQDRRATVRVLERAHALDPVIVHGDVHEGQLLVDPDDPATLTGVLDWQTASIDRPFADFDLGEWGTAMWRGHRGSFAHLRRCAWDAYATARGLEPEVGVVFEWFHAASHLARLAGPNGFPVQHVPGITGSVVEARAALDRALAATREG